MPFKGDLRRLKSRHISFGPVCTACNEARMERIYCQPVEVVRVPPSSPLWCSKKICRHILWMIHKPKTLTPVLFPLHVVVIVSDKSRQIVYPRYLSSSVDYVKIFLIFLLIGHKR